MRGKEEGYGSAVGEKESERANGEMAKGRGARARRGGDLGLNSTEHMGRKDIRVMRESRWTMASRRGYSMGKGI